MLFFCISARYLQVIEQTPLDERNNQGQRLEH